MSDQRYRVSWVIDLDAASPLEAARAALAIQRDPGSTSTVFDVADDVGDDSVRVDLEAVECDEGVHSWSTYVGKLPPTHPCLICGACYGDPA